MVFVGGIAVIAFSQLKFSTGQKVEATVVSIGTEEGVTGTEAFLIVETDDAVTSKVASKGEVKAGDRVVLDVFDRILFRDVYRME